MEPDARINAALRRAISMTAQPACPPVLAQAMEYAVFPGGHRIRPRLCLAVAAAQASVDPDVVDAALASIELLHCASLVHDDMPCFDDAATRRGKPSVHVRFGEPVALLCGDALIVLAFQVLARSARFAPGRASQLMEIVGDAVGAPDGIVAGQAWECEAAVPLDEYQRAKTGILFAAATMAGAAAAGAAAGPWAELGARIGGAYQIADDLLDQFGMPEIIGKPVGQDAAFERPNAVNVLGEAGARNRLRQTIEAAADCIPDCPGQASLKKLIHEEATHFMNRALGRRAAA